MNQFHHPASIAGSHKPIPLPRSSQCNVLPQTNPIALIQPESRTPINQFHRPDPASDAHPHCAPPQINPIAWSSHVGHSFFLFAHFSIWWGPPEFSKLSKIKCLRVSPTRLTNRQTSQRMHSEQECCFGGFTEDITRWQLSSVVKTFCTLALWLQSQSLRIISCPPRGVWSIERVDLRGETYSTRLQFSVPFRSTYIPEICHKLVKYRHFKAPSLWSNGILSCLMVNCCTGFVNSETCIFVVINLSSYMYS